MKIMNPSWFHFGSHLDCVDGHLDCVVLVAVASHLPFLFHIVTLLVSTGPLSLRASTHGLVINIIHSLCTCSQLNISGQFTCPLSGCPQHQWSVHMSTLWLPSTSVVSSHVHSLAAPNATLEDLTI